MLICDVSACEYLIDARFRFLCYCLGDDAGALSLAAPKGIAGRAAMQAIKNIDAKKAATVAGGVVLATSVISLAGKYRFYKGIVAGELKKQLNAVNKKLDALQKQNEELQEEIAELKAEQKKQNR